MNYEFEALKKVSQSFLDEKVLLEQRINQLIQEKEDIKKQSEAEIQKLKDQHKTILKEIGRSISRSEEKEKDLLKTINDKDSRIEELLRQLETAKLDLQKMEELLIIDPDKYAEYQRLNGINEDDNVLDKSKKHFKSVNPYDMLKTIKFKFRNLNNNFYYNEDNQSV